MRLGREAQVLSKDLCLGCGGKGLPVAGDRQGSMCGTSRRKLRRPVSEAVEKLTGSGMACRGAIEGLSHLSCRSLSGV